MIDKKQRSELLKRLSASSEGVALKELFEELITKLTDSRNYNSEEFEMEGRSSLKAANILEGVLRHLQLLKRPKKERGQNQYL